MSAPVAIVTGGARGIGRAVARRLAADGYAVVAGDTDAGLLAELSAERAITTVPTDVALPGDCERLVGTAFDRHGRIDALVNSAGVSGRQAPIAELTADDIEQAMRVNLLGAFSCIKAAAPAMVAARRGAIVNIGSVAAKFPQPNRIAYAASKLALVGLSRVAAQELAPHRVRCNVISPGPVAGPRLDEVVRAGATAQGRSPEEVRRAMDALMPLGEPTTPEAVAALVAYLCSPDARHVTGEDINIDSGIPAY